MNNLEKSQNMITKKANRLSHYHLKSNEISCEFELSEILYEEIVDTELFDLLVLDFNSIDEATVYLRDITFRVALSNLH